MSTSNLQNGNHENQQADNQLWTVQDVAQFMKCSLRHVSNLQRAGLPFMKLGHLTRFDRTAVMRWIHGGC